MLESLKISNIWTNYKNNVLGIFILIMGNNCHMKNINKRLKTDQMH